MMSNGTFRADLYYRIRVLNLHLKPLRERKDDILYILNEMLKRKGHTKHIKIDEVILNHLREYNWPGNIRELRTTADYIHMLQELRENGDYNSSDIKNMLKLFLENNLAYQNQDNENYSHDSNSKQKIVAENKGNTFVNENLLLILNAIKELEKQSKIAGRGSLRKLPQLQEVGLTEAKIKTRLKKLEKMGFVSIGVTKQGVILTQKGNKALNDQIFQG